MSDKKSVLNSIPDGMRCKKASTSFFQFLSTVRNKIKDENPNYTDHDISKAAAIVWNKFSSEEKKPYNDLYIKEKLELEKNPQFVPIINNSTNKDNKRKIDEVYNDKKITLEKENSLSNCNKIYSLEYISNRLDFLDNEINSLKKKLDNN